MSNASQDENEKPAKVWQVNELSSKIDTLTTLVTARNDSIYSKVEVDLLLEKQANRIDSLRKNLGNYNKIVWLLASTLVPIAALMVWQLLVNNSKVG